MSRIIVKGSTAHLEAYLERYVAANMFEPFEIKKYQQTIKIDDAKDIRKLLSMRHSKLLIVLHGELTIECQNALLKSIEETGEHIHFLFCVEKFDHLLSTVRSRCIEVELEIDEVIDPALVQFVAMLHNSKAIDWATVDALSEHTKSHGLATLLPILRYELLKTVDRASDASLHYAYCKRLLKLLPLAHNNINQKILLEKVFA